MFLYIYVHVHVHVNVYVGVGVGVDIDMDTDIDIQVGMKIYRHIIYTYAHAYIVYTYTIYILYLIYTLVLLYIVIIPPSPRPSSIRGTTASTQLKIQKLLAVLDHMDKTYGVYAVQMLSSIRRQRSTRWQRRD